MQKIVYDSLYKFLVSLGMVIFVLPFIILFFFYGKDPILISQKDFDSLSQYSKYNLDIREKLICVVNGKIIWIFLICTIIGIILIVYGFICWKKVQKQIDLELELRNEKQYRELSSIEIINKVSEDIAETESDGGYVNNNSVNNYEETDSRANSREDETRIKNNINISNSNDDRSDYKMIDKEKQNNKDQLIIEYLKVENCVYEKLMNTIGKEYEIKRDIKIGRFMGADIIAKSKESNIDLMYEIKYFKRGITSVSRLADTFDRLKKLEREYETEYHRNVRGILIIVTPDIIQDSFMEKFVELSHRVDDFGIKTEFYSLKELQIN